MKKVMLLDCDQETESAIRECGFEVVSGTTGFQDGVRDIPEVLYEQDIIFYDIKRNQFLENTSITEQEKNTFIINGIEKPAGIRLEDIEDFFKNGGMIVTFCNPIIESESSDDLKKSMAVYGWIPSFPVTFATHDMDVRVVADPEKDEEAAFISLFHDCSLSKPVKREMVYYGEYPYAKKLLVNKKGNILAGYKNIENGMSVSLPAFEDTTDAVKHILMHVYPKIFNMHPTHPLIKIPSSSNSKRTQQKIDELEEVINEKTEELTQLRAILIIEDNETENLINTDQNTRRLLGYLEDASQDMKGSWHSCFKAIELLCDIYGGEQCAKAELNGAIEINYIKKITNERYRDTRHSPKPGEITTPPTKEELNQMISYTKELVQKYLVKLVNNINPENTDISKTEKS